MELWRKGTAGTSFPFGYCSEVEEELVLVCTKIQSQTPCTNSMVASEVWKVQGTMDKGCSRYWIGGPTGSGKTLVAA